MHVCNLKPRYIHCTVLQHALILNENYTVTFTLMSYSHVMKCSSDYVSLIPTAQFFEHILCKFLDWTRPPVYIYEVDK